MWLNWPGPPVSCTYLTHLLLTAPQQQDLDVYGLEPDTVRRESLPWYSPPSLIMFPHCWQWRPGPSLENSVYMKDIPKGLGHTWNKLGHLAFNGQEFLK